MVTALKEIGEFGFIDMIKKICHTQTGGLIKGIGDDCAVIGPFDDKAFLMSTDIMIEGIHFILKSTSPYHLGQKAIAVNLSDIAAMGGTPLYILVSVAVHRDMDAGFLMDMYAGMKDMCTQYSVSIVGGDTSASTGDMIVNITVTGEADVNNILYRSGAGVGDDIYLVGNIGDSCAGLKLIKKEATAPEAIALRLKAAHNRPVPMIAEGQAIARSGLASAMIDISDGLVADLGHICNNSKVGARLFQKHLPISEELRAFANINNMDPYKLALSGGEDYALLITAPRKHREAVFRIFDTKKLHKIHRIGEITAGKGIEIISLKHTHIFNALHGFDHFA